MRTSSQFVFRRSCAPHIHSVDFVCVQCATDMLIPHEVSCNDMLLLHLLQGGTTGPTPPIDLSNNSSSPATATVGTPTTADSSSSMGRKMLKN